MNDEIIDYLYFFWAPLLEAHAIRENEMDDLQKMIILTMSQPTRHVEAPAYTLGTSSREYPTDIINGINDLAGKISANIHANDSYWLKITITNVVPAAMGFTNTDLQPVSSFGPFAIAGNKTLSFEFYYLTHQLQLWLPTTGEISAIISTTTPVAISDGPVATINIQNCTIWLSALHFDSTVGDASLYTCVRLKKCNISFDSGYEKSGHKIAAGLFNSFAGFVITCIPEDETNAASDTTVAAGNTVIYPNKFVFSFKHRPGLQPQKITLTHAEPFSSLLFGSTVPTVATSDVTGNWIANQRMLSFPLSTEDNVFSAIENSSPVFNLKGQGTIKNMAWYFPVVSTSHPLSFAILGLGAGSGYLGFDVEGGLTLTWNGLENGPLKLKTLFIRSSPDKLIINYTGSPSVTAKQKLQLWEANNNQKGHSVIDISYGVESKGNFISLRESTEQNSISTNIIANIDRPLLTNGDRIFLKTSGELTLIRDENAITAVVVGGAMDPSIAFESNAFKQLSSIALSNALILVKPIDIFLLSGQLNDEGVASQGECIIQFPIKDIEHTLPDPYITSLFNERPKDNGNPPLSRRLVATVRWNEADGPELIIQLADAQGNIFTPKATISDEAFANRLLNFPFRHPAEAAYDDLLRNAIASSGRHVSLFPDNSPYRDYQSFYHSKTNTTGAFSTLHILPGNVSLADISGRASQMGVAFTRDLNNTENGIDAVLENTGYTIRQTYRIKNNELVSSGRFVRAFTLPHVQWEPLYFENDHDNEKFFNEEDPFPAHGVPTRIASANKIDVTLAPIPVTKYIVDGFRDEKNKYAAAAHFALPFGMNAVALFHPMNAFKIDVFDERITRSRDIFSYSKLNFNQPVFPLKKGNLSGAIQIKTTSEGYPKVSRSDRPDPSFHGAVLQIPNQLRDFKIVGNNATYEEDSILGNKVTQQFNTQMWGKYILDAPSSTLNFVRSRTAKVPLRRIDFSGFGASIFSNWFDKTADGGAVSQVKFNILIGRVAHEVVQIKSVIAPFFIPVVRTIIIERKNHANIIRTDSGWVPTGPGVFHYGYDCHPGVIRGVYNVTSIKDTEISIPQKILNKDVVNMTGVYYDADVLIENVVSGFKVTEHPPTENYKFVPSKKQFGYIILGNNSSEHLEKYYVNEDLQNFMSRPDVGPLGGPVDCVVNIAGSDQLMHLTRVDVTAVMSAMASVAAARGTLQLPKGGSWSVVKKKTNGATSPLRNDETVPLIRNGLLNLEAVTQKFLGIDSKDSLHVLGDPLSIDKYVAASSALADVEYALLQSTDTQKLLFPRPSFDSKNDSVITNGITEGEKRIFVTDPLIADPYSLLKSNTLFPDGADALTLGESKGFVKKLIINKASDGISFPNDVADKLENFIPLKTMLEERSRWWMKAHLKYILITVEARLILINSYLR